MLELIIQTYRLIKNNIWNILCLFLFHSTSCVMLDHHNFCTIHGKAGKQLLLITFSTNKFNDSNSFCLLSNNVELIDLFISKTRYPHTIKTERFSDFVNQFIKKFIHFVEYSSETHRNLFKHYKIQALSQFN
jgi:hypothetical protein